MTQFFGFSVLQDAGSFLLKANIFLTFLNLYGLSVNGYNAKPIYVQSIIIVCPTQGTEICFFIDILLPNTRTQHLID